MITRKNIPEVMLAMKGSREDLNRKDMGAETKWDGTRLLIIKKGMLVKLFVARGKHREYSDRYPDIVADVRRLRTHSCIIDGEFAFFDKNGINVFVPISAKPETVKGLSHKVMAFEALMVNGIDARKYSYNKRKALLFKIVPPGLATIKVTPTVRNNKEAFFEEQVRKYREGVMLKMYDSPYVPGRSNFWLKIKDTSKGHDIDVLVKGGTIGKGARKPYFGALHCFYPIKRVLSYVGDVGTGFSDDELRTITPLLRRNKAFVIQVKYYQFSKHDHMRFPVFVRLRPDKTLYDVMKNGG